MKLSSKFSIDFILRLLQQIILKKVSIDEVVLSKDLYFDTDIGHTTNFCALKTIGVLQLPRFFINDISHYLVHFQSQLETPIMTNRKIRRVKMSPETA